MKELKLSKKEIEKLKNYLESLKKDDKLKLHCYFCNMPLNNNICSYCLTDNTNRVNDIVVRTSLEFFKKEILHKK